MAEIIPAILPVSLADLKEKLGRIRSLSQWVEIDGCDGTLTKNISWPYNDRQEFEKIGAGSASFPFVEDFNFEVHLMIEKPEEEIEKWLAAGFSRLIVQAEAQADFARIKKMTADRAELGLAMKIETGIEAVKENWGKFDFIQLMAIDEIGQQGFGFDPKVIEKIKLLKKTFPGLTVTVDGGIKSGNAKLISEAGADRLIIGSAVFDGNAAENLKGFYEVLDHA